MDAHSFEIDIPESLALAAHQGTSFVPGTRAKQERESYSQSLFNDYECFRRAAEQGGTLNLLDDEFSRYRTKLAELTRAYLGSRSRCLSSMITGPSNFPTRRNEKRNAAADKRLRALVDYRERARAAIVRTLRPDLQPIRGSDTDVKERLRAELEKLEALQARMRAANAAIRKHHKNGIEAQVAALIGLGLSDKMARELLQPDFTGRLGFASFQLSGNNANIRRIKARIECVTTTQAMPISEVQGVNARFEDDPPANRVRLYFPSKPSRSSIRDLKAHAFRWTPSLGAWQAYRNSRSIKFAREMAGVPTGSGSNE